MPAVTSHHPHQGQGGAQGRSSAIPNTPRGLLNGWMWGARGGRAARMGPHRHRVRSTWGRVSGSPTWVCGSRGSAQPGREPRHGTTEGAERTDTSGGLGPRSRAPEPEKTGFWGGRRGGRPTAGTGARRSDCPLSRAWGNSGTPPTHTRTAVPPALLASPVKTDGARRARVAQRGLSLRRGGRAALSLTHPQAAVWGRKFTS